MDNTRWLDAPDHASAAGWKELKEWCLQESGNKNIASVWPATQNLTDPVSLKRWAALKVAGDRASSGGSAHVLDSVLMAYRIEQLVYGVSRNPVIRGMVGPMIRAGWDSDWVMTQVYRAQSIGYKLNDNLHLRSTRRIERLFGEAATAAADDPGRINREEIGLAVAAVGLFPKKPLARSTSIRDVLRWLTAIQTTVIDSTEGLGATIALVDLVARWDRTVGPDGLEWAAAGFSLDETIVLRALPVEHSGRPSMDTLRVMAALRGTYDY